MLHGGIQTADGWLMGFLKGRAKVSLLIFGFGLVKMRPQAAVFAAAVCTVLVRERLCASLPIAKELAQTKCVRVEMTLKLLS